MPVHAAFLKYFAETCKTGSMRLAAKNLHVTSSSLNRKINEIERELGVELFKRTRQGVELTDAGAILLRHAQRTLSDYQDTLVQLRTIARQSNDVVTLVAPESIISWFLPPVLSEFHAHFPQITTAFKAVTDTQLLLNSVDGNPGDIIFGFDLPKSESFVEIARCTLPVGVVTDKSHPLSKRRKISLQNCLDYPWVLPDPSWPLTQILNGVIKQYEYQPDIVTSSNSVEFLRLMIGQKTGIGFQTIVGIENEVEKGELCFLPIVKPEVLVQELAIFRRSGLIETPATRLLVENLCKRLQIYN